ncbi:hypothetical protein BD626DRAFT_621957 [Schizophyllum amplum]|uniref:Uncharacterized protein n=1 Tax=Schizophyllum amplum TaxID=97359 RepID=A0A550CFM3_9AGAR|nr:hypothetical protein BD626DRAFT_621957 [Auriculariopsis ampla]
MRTSASVTPNLSLSFLCLDFEIRVSPTPGDTGLKGPQQDRLYHLAVTLYPTATLTASVANMPLSNRDTSACTLKSQKVNPPRLKIKSRPSKQMYNAALAGVLGYIGTRGYPLPDIHAHLSTSIGLDAPGLLSGPFADFEVAELRGDGLIYVIGMALLLSMYPDLCADRPQIMEASLGALTCNVTLSAIAKALCLWPGRVPVKAAADLMEAIVGTLDATFEGNTKAHIFVTYILGPLVTPAVEASFFQPVRVRSLVPTFTILKERISPENSPAACIRLLDPLVDAGKDLSRSNDSASADATRLLAKEATTSDAVENGVHAGDKRPREAQEDHELEERNDDAVVHMYESPSDNVDHHEDDGDWVDELDSDAAEPRHKKRKVVDDEQRPKATKQQDTGHRTSKEFTSRRAHESPRLHTERLIKRATYNAVDVAFWYPVPTATISFMLIVNPISYGERIDSKVGNFLLRYVLVAALHDAVRTPGGLTAQAAAMALNSMTSEYLLSRVAHAIGLSARESDAAAHKAFLCVLGRASYCRPSSEIREHLLAIFAPLVPVAMMGVQPLIRVPTPAKGFEKGRAHLRLVLELQARGITFDSGLTPLEALLSTNQIVVAAMLDTDLLEEVGII